MHGLHIWLTDSFCCVNDRAHDNDVKEANKTKSTPPHRPSSLQSQPQTSHLSPVPAIQRPASSSSSSTPQLLFQPDAFPHLSQHSPSLSQLQALADSQVLGPVVSMSQDFLQSHRMGLLTGAPPITPGGVFPSYSTLTSGLQPGARALPLQGPISVQMALAGEPRHCLSMAYSGGYLGAHHTFTAGCFDRWRQETEREHKPPRESTSLLPAQKHPLTDLFSLSVGTATPPARPAPPPPSQRRLKRKQRSKGRTDQVEVITLTWRMLNRLLSPILRPVDVFPAVTDFLWSCSYETVITVNEMRAAVWSYAHLLVQCLFSAVRDSWANFRSAQNTKYLCGARFAAWCLFLFVSNPKNLNAFHRKLGWLCFLYARLALTKDRTNGA